MLNDEQRAIVNAIYDKHVRPGMRYLRGKNLACWCPLDAPCHADVLLRIANEPRAAQSPSEDK